MQHQPELAPQRSRKTRPTKPRAIIQLIAIQARLFADIEKDDTSPMARAQSARAWKELQDLRLRMKMIPAPKPVDVLELRAAKVGGSFARAKVQANLIELTRLLSATRAVETESETAADLAYLRGLTHLNTTNATPREKRYGERSGVFPVIARDRRFEALHG